MLQTLCLNIVTAHHSHKSQCETWTPGDGCERVGLWCVSIVLVAAWQSETVCVWENESVCLCLSEEPVLYWNVRSHIVTNFPRGMQCVNTSHLADARRANWQRIPSVKTHTLLSGLRLIACRIPYDEQLICTESNAAPAEGRKHGTEEEREDENKD